MTGSMPAPAPLVSVIIPAYNAESTIAETLASVRAQTYQALEIIVVDDGSTDGTQDIVWKMASAEPRLHVICQENGGVARARNAAIAAARGEWIATIDADDIWNPEKLERQVRVAMTSPLCPVLVYSWCRRIDAEGRVTADQGRPLHEGMAFDQLLGFNFINNASNALVRTDAARAVGGYEEAFQAFRAYGAEDIAFYLAIAERGPVAPAPGFLVGYRVTGKGMSAAPRRMRMAVEMVLFRLEQTRPDIPASLFALSRVFYDIYAASLALSSGHRGLFAKFLGQAMMRRPGLTSLFLICVLFWRRAEARMSRKGKPLFSSLRIEDSSYRQIFLEAFDRYRTRQIRLAADKPKRQPVGIY